MKILFQGDSITDAGRLREDPHNLGNGYPKYAAEAIRSAFPDREFEFVNLGIGGNQTKDIVARMETDIADVQPDLISILIGVNDVWHHAADRSWIPMELFESNYRSIIELIRTRTHAKLVMMEPFLLPAADKEFFREDLDPKIQIVRKLARAYADVYIPLDGLLAAACIGGHDYDFSDDGVHPNEAGRKLIGGIYADAVHDLIAKG